MSARVLLFDVDGVLIHSRFHPDVARRRLWDEHLMTDMGIAPERLKGLFGPHFMDVITGKTSLITALDRYLPETGYRGSTLNFISYWMERDAQLNYALIDAISRLRQSGEVRVFLATNQEHVRAAFLWREFRLGHVFEDMFYAARLGAAKPDRAFYERVAAHLPASDASPLLFDDSEPCVAAANAFGWEGVHFTDLDHFTEHPFVAAHLG